MVKQKPKPVAAVGPVPTLDDYVREFCAAPLTRKAVMDLSSTLAKVVGAQIQRELPDQVLEVGHRFFGGSVRRHHLDCFIANRHYGLQLGIDVKGLNSASSVGKNWNNRVGDLHELATNHHNNFPRAVMGGVLAIPYEELTDSILRNIERAMMNLHGRKAVTNAQNLLEQSCLIVISKERQMILPDIPLQNGPLRIETCAPSIAAIFRQRWG